MLEASRKKEEEKKKREAEREAKMADAAKAAGKDPAATRKKDNKKDKKKDKKDKGPKGLALGITFPYIERRVHTGLVALSQISESVSKCREGNQCLPQLHSLVYEFQSGHIS